MHSGYEALPAIWLSEITVYSDHCVFWVVQGRARVWAGDRTYEVGEREALWIPAGTTVGSFQTAAGSVALFVLLPGRRAPASPSGVVLHRLDGAASDSLVAAYVRWVMPFWVEHETVDALAVLSRSSDVAGTIGYPPLPDRSPALDVATSLIQDPARARTAREWAAAAGTSERNLTRSFLAETGLTFSAWRTSLRIAHAVRLLREGLAPCDIAHAVGYGSTAAFDHAFRRVTGVTPSRATEALARDPGDTAPASRATSWPVLDAGRPRRPRGRHGATTTPAGPPPDARPAMTWPRINDVHVLVWMFRGSSVVEIGAVAVRLGEGEALWLPAGVRCRIRTGDGGIVVPVGELPAGYALRGGRPTPIRIPPGREPEMLYRSAASHTCLRPYPHRTEHLADLLASSGSGAPAGRRARDPVGRMLAAPLSDARTIRDWATDLDIPTDRLARRFRARTGHSFREWRGNRRMTLARELLTRSGATPSQVAGELGYSRLSAFTRAFTRHHDTTPTAFQRRYRHVAHFVADDDAAG